MRARWRLVSSCGLLGPQFIPFGQKSHYLKSQANTWFRRTLSFTGDTIRSRQANHWILIIIMHYIYISLFSPLKGLLHLLNHHQCAASTYSRWCNGSHSVPEYPPHTSLLVERRRWEWWSQNQYTYIFHLIGSTTRHLPEFN